MRFSSSLVLALPLLAVAESPFEEYKAKFQNFLGSFGATAPSQDKQDAAEPVAAKIAPKKMAVLTLNNWKETLYKPVAPDATVPVEWWVLLSGGNKTCFGHCLTVETAFNETAAKFATQPKAPHMAYVNCDAERILCNSWSCATGNIWAFHMLPPPAPIDIYRKRLNLTTTTSKTLVDLNNLPTKYGGGENEFRPLDSVFHPFDGFFAQYNLSVPLGYIFWAFSVVPNWLFMLGVSFISRSLMTRRMNNQMGGAQAGARGAPAAAR